MSILTEGNTDLDEYQDPLIKEIDYSLEINDGHIYSIFPIGVSILALPFVFVIDVVADRMLEFDLDAYVHNVVPGGIEVFIASVLVAFAAMVIYGIARLQLGVKQALLIVFIFAFGTSAWSTGSRALWQHGPTMLMLAMALYFILLAKKRPSMVQYAALPLAFSYLIRPTNSVSIGILTLYVLIEHRRYFLHYLGWAALIAVPFFLFNLRVYEEPFSPYYGLTPDNQSDRWGTSRLFEALAGNLISPSRGLFIFSPVLLFFLYGIYVKVRSGTFERLDYCLLAIMTLNWVMISPFPYWWGGHSYGSRYLSDLIPYLIYFLIPAVGALFQVNFVPSFRPVIPARIAMAAVFTVFVAASFVIHYRGANSFEVVLWNVEPNNIDQNPGRIWDLGDIQFLRGIED